MAGLAGAVLLYHGQAQAVSSSILNFEKADIVGSENQCSSNLADERKTGSPPRTQVDNSRPYSEIYWITPAGNPASTITGAAGSTGALPLQLNGMQFICSILTSPNSGRTTPLASTVVTNGNFPNDRSVNPDNGNVDAASRYQLRTRVVSASVVAGPGSLSGVDAGLVITTSRVSSSRYWGSPTAEDFNYVPPAGGLPSGTTSVTVRFVVQRAYTYNANAPGGVMTCTNKNNTSVSTDPGYPVNWGVCSTANVNVTFKITAHNPDLDPVVSGSACNITGTAVDGDSPNTQLKINVYDGATLKATTTTSGSSHSFTVNRSLLGATTDWTAHTYRVHAYGVNTSGLPASPDTDKNVTVGPCAQLSCGAMTPALGAVGQQINFRVYMKVAQTTTSPPGVQKFSVKVSGPGGTQTYTPDDEPLSGGTIYSAASQKMSFTPSTAGTYTIAWTYYGKTCSTAADAAYAPFFSVQGGDIAAGARFGAATPCPAAADITGTNLGTDTAPNYFGAGSEVGALATGTITNFVSGLGLGGGAVPQTGTGLSFANTIGTGGTTYGGQYSLCGLPAVTDYAAQTTGGGWGGWGSIGGTGPHNYSVTTSLLTLSGGMTLQPDTTVNLYVKGNVYIKDDITYAAYTLGHAPRFNLYVSGNIYVDPNVAELHGVYVAQTGAPGSGNIDTCAAVAGGTVTTSLPYGRCKKDLTVDGSVLAEGKLIFTRTFGNVVPAPGAPAAPAETFRYGPELWLSASGKVTLDTQAYTSLPPVL